MEERAAGVGVQKVGNGVRIRIGDSGQERHIDGSHLLLAVGRRPNVAGLGFETAGVAYDDGGLKVDSRLRTSNRRISAVGDVTGDPQFSHMAVHHCKVVIRNALFRIPAKVDRRFVPRVTYTAPELAYVGLQEDEARTREGRIRVLRWNYADNDRALAERETDGMIKIIVAPSGRILGAGIVGPRAGEVVQTWCLALRKGLKIGDIAGMITPYPTLGYSNRNIAETFFTPKLKGRFVRGLVGAIARLP